MAKKVGQIGKQRRWDLRIKDEIAARATEDSSGERKAYAVANAEMARRAVDGRGPDDEEPVIGSGARMVVNISSAHVPAFCRASASGEARPYKNAYDLGRYRLGDEAPEAAPPRRVYVDRALPVKPSPAEIYFGAIELNGTGVRFYGDVCLVLRLEAVDPSTVILDRNSYDLVRPPISDRFDFGDVRAMRREAKRLAGRWDRDRGSMVALKMLQSSSSTIRRVSTGQVSGSMLDDEDYIEVLKVGSFGASNVQEARLSAAEAAVDARTAEAMRLGPMPSAAAVLWRLRRRTAERALGRVGLQMRVVTTSGRVRG
jgi:hypothetical protein